MHIWDSARNYIRIWVAALVLNENQYTLLFGGNNDIIVICRAKATGRPVHFLMRDETTRSTKTDLPLGSRDRSNMIVVCVCVWLSAFCVHSIGYIFYKISVWVSVCVCVCVRYEQQDTEAARATWSTAPFIHFQTNQIAWSCEMRSPLSALLLVWHTLLGQRLFVCVYCAGPIWPYITGRTIVASHARLC